MDEKIVNSWPVYDDKGFVGILSMREGKKLVEGEDSSTYIQLILDDQRSGVTSDDFQDEEDVCLDIKAHLAIGEINWYGRKLTIKRPGDG